MKKTQPRILLIDKEPWWADDFFKRVLSLRGYRVEVEHDEKRALSRLGNRRYELIVLDSLSGKEELGTLRAIRARYPDVRVIVVSAAPSWRGARESFRLGAIDYLSKSYDEERLVKSVETALGNSPTKC